MKKLTFMLLSFMATTALVSCGDKKEKDGDKEKSTESSEKKPTTDEAIAFSDAIVADENSLLELEHNLVVAIETKGGNEVVDQTFDAFVAEVDRLIKKYEAMPAFDKEDEFRKAYLAYLKVVKDKMNNELAQMIEFHHTKSETATEEEWDEFVALAEAFEAGIKKGFDDVVAQQKVFAKKYNFDLY
jgi:hypothetical protein